MGLELISGLAEGQYTAGARQIPSYNTSQHLAQQGSKVQGALDQFEVSEAARLAIETDELGLHGDKKTPGALDKFRLALIKFTNFALKIHGFSRQAEGKDARLALMELAKRSGIQMPQNLHENQERMLAVFQEEWKFDEGSTIEDIFQKMVRVFGGPNNDENNNLALNTVEDMDGTDRDPKFKPEDPFHTAINRISSQLSDLVADREEQGEDASQRVLTALAERLDLPAEPGKLDAGLIARTLGVNKGLNVGQIVSMISRAFFE